MNPSVEAYTAFSVVIILFFILANHYYGLPWYGNIGLLYSLVLCVKGLS